MRFSSARWFAELGVKITRNLPLELDPVYALDASDLRYLPLRNHKPPDIW